MLTKLVKENFNGKLVIFAGVKGLMSHGNDLKSYLETNRPEILLISISPEEVQGLGEFIKSPFEMNLSDYEVIYGVRLSKYGEVMTPPPIYIEAITYSTNTGAISLGIDIPQAEFDELYTNSMKSRHLIRHSLRKKRVLNREYGDTNEYEFAEAWIKRINSIKGLAAIDEKRAEYMSSRIIEFTKSGYAEKHAIVIDYEFYRPVIENLRKSGWNQQTVA